MIGESAGRSRRNRTGEGATRRNTQRERADIDPPVLRQVPGQQEPHWTDRLTPRGWHLLDALALACWVAMTVFLAILVCGWFGLL